MRQITFTVRELQTHLGEAFRAVERGDRVYITSHGKPVAMLAKPSGMVIKESPVRRKLRRLAAEGKVILGTGGPIRDFPCMPMGGLMRQFLEDRRSGDRSPEDQKRRGRKARS